jgi:hypothetical protein
MRKNVLLLAILLLPLIMNAQQKQWKPWGVAEAGLIVGSYGPSGDLRVQGGMKKGDWLFGLGAAHDGYKYQSIPVFVQARKMFGKKQIKPFVMGSAGANFEHVKDVYDDRVYIAIIAPPQYSYSTGLYGELAAGLAFRTHKTFGFNLSFGYTRKTMTENYSWTILNGSGTGENNFGSTKYLMNRWAFRLAISY